MTRQGVRRVAALTLIAVVSAVTAVGAAHRGEAVLPPPVVPFAEVKVMYNVPGPSQIQVAPNPGDTTGALVPVAADGSWSWQTDSGTWPAVGPIETGPTFGDPPPVAGDYTIEASCYGAQFALIFNYASTPYTVTETSPPVALSAAVAAPVPTLTVEPTSSPAGTVLQVRATGCVAPAVEPTSAPSTTTTPAVTSAVQPAFTG